MNARDRRTLARNLRHRRKEAGFSQTELAQAAGISQGSVSAYECADPRRVPPYAALAALAAVLGCSIDDLAPGATPPELAELVKRWRKLPRRIRREIRTCINQVLP